MGLEMKEEGRAFSRVADEEKLPSNWGIEALCSFEGKYCKHLYVIYNHGQIHHHTVVDVNELPCNLQL